MPRYNDIDQILDVSDSFIRHYPATTHDFKTAAAKQPIIMLLNTRHTDIIVGVVFSVVSLATKYNCDSTLKTEFGLHGARRCTTAE